MANKMYNIHSTNVQYSKRQRMPFFSDPYKTRVSLSEIDDALGIPLESNQWPKRNRKL